MSYFATPMLLHVCSSSSILLCHSKSKLIKKNLYFRQSVLNKILAPDVFDNGDSKFESWHRAKKIREVFMVNKSSRALFAVMENRVCFGRRFKTMIKLLTNCRSRKIF